MHMSVDALRIATLSGTRKKASSALELYEQARALGCRFRLLPEERVEIFGPREIMLALNDEFDEHARWMLALAEEFHNPVAAAEELISVHTSWGRHTQRRT